MAPPTPRRQVFHLFAGAVDVDLHHRAPASSSSTGRPAAAELWGLLRQHLLRRSTETGLLAALAPRIGGSAAGADRSAEIGRVNLLPHPHARARRSQQGVAMAHRRRADRLKTRRLLTNRPCLGFVYEESHSKRTSTRQQLDCAKTLSLCSQRNRRTLTSGGPSACS